MKRIKKAFKALGLLIRNPWKLNLILDQNEEWEKYVWKKYAQTSLPVVPLKYFIHDAALVEPFAFLDGGSSPTDIALLKQLAADIPDCRYFEIGTWRGESVSNVSAASGICYSLNLPDKELFKLTGSEDYVNSHRFFSKTLKNITHLYGDSATFNYTGLNLKFDLIFIDGDHHYEAIVKDTRNMLQYLCHDETIIVWHDYAYTPESVRYETMAAVLDACPASLHPFLYYVRNTNCVLLYRKKISSFPFKKFARPDYSFTVQIKISPVDSI
jgi:predicted O-methyltransferase YrrM